MSVVLAVIIPSWSCQFDQLHFAVRFYATSENRVGTSRDEVGTKKRKSLFWSRCNLGHTGWNGEP